MMMTPALVEQLHKQEGATLATKYGGYYSIPRDELTKWQERTRARWVLEGAPRAAGVPDRDPLTALKRHAVAQSVIEELLGDVTRTPPPPKRVDKYAACIEWCETHPYEQLTPDMLAEVSGFSRSTALKFIQDRLDLFRWVKRGWYEVRDPKKERMAEGK